MRIVPTYIKLICLLVCILLVQGCSKDGIIRTKDMTSIIVDMYLADQYIDRNPQMRGQTDSLFVYPAIVEKYGYSMEEYVNSVKYYLQEDGMYNTILKDAMDIVDERVDVLDIQIAEIEKLRRGPVKWWALDSVRRVAPDELLYDKMLRGLRWLVLGKEELVKWNFRDSAIVDIPQNPQWWMNNMDEPQREFTEFFVRMSEQEKADARKAEVKADSLKNESLKKEDLKKKDLKKDTLKKAGLKPLAKVDSLKLEEIAEKEELEMQNMK